jgi:hypothetical protein
MTFAENESVTTFPIGILRPKVHHAAVQHCKCVDYGEAGTNVRGSCTMDHLEDIESDITR